MTLPHEDLLVSALDIVAVHDALDESRPIEVRRDLRRRAGPGSASRTSARLHATGRFPSGAPAARSIAGRVTDLR